nr:hypothetical protein BN993_06029 [Virgibacillus halodenitrificans]
MAGFAVASWAGIILTIGFWIFGDDALEAWCKRCVFTTESVPDHYADYAEEVGALVFAAAVLAGVLAASAASGKHGLRAGVRGVDALSVWSPCWQRRAHPALAA